MDKLCADIRITSDTAPQRAHNTQSSMDAWCLQRAGDVTSNRRSRCSVRCVLRRVAARTNAQGLVRCKQSLAQNSLRRGKNESTDITSQRQSGDAARAGCSPVVRFIVMHQRQRCSPSDRQRRIDFSPMKTINFVRSVPANQSTQTTNKASTIRPAIDASANTRHRFVDENGVISPF